jgi:hypothetical protein
MHDRESSITAHPQSASWELFTHSPLPNDDGRLATHDEIEQTLRYFSDQNQVLHLIALGHHQQGLQLPCQIGGFFDAEHIANMAQEAIKFSPSSKGVYFALNPLHQDCLAKRCNRVERLGKNESIKETEVLWRRWMYVDFDPVHPCGIQGIAATNDERRQAFDAAIRFANDLTSQGFPPPLFGDTGNGFHLYYRIELPTDSKLVQEFIAAVAQVYSSPQVKVDPVVHNANRITRVYGTQNRKGDPVPGRRHRYSRILYRPSDRRVVDEQQLQTAINSLQRHVATSHPTFKAEDREFGNLQSDIHDRAKNPSHRLIGLPHSEVLRRARAYVAKMAPAIQGHGGDNQTYTVACRLTVGFDLSPHDALPLLLEYNDRCQPPWAESALARKLELARQAGTADEFGKLLQDEVARSSRETTPITTLPELQGPRFPVIVPDFVPVPTSWISFRLDDSLLAHPRGRRPRHIEATIRWILIWQSLDQERIPPIVPDQLLKYCLYGRDGRNGWKNTLKPRPGRPLVSVEWFARRINTNQTLINQLIPVLQAITEQEQRGILPSNEQNDAIERVTCAIDENARIASRLTFSSCPSDCPFHDSLIAHEHFVSPIVSFIFGDDFRAFTSCDNQYQRIDLNKVVDGKILLGEFRKQGRFRYAYLPALIFGDCCGFSPRQVRLIQTLVFETTRLPKKQRGNVMRSGCNVTAVIRNAAVPARSGQGTILCPLLDRHKEYVQFNGNLRKQPGSGYLIAGNRRQQTDNQGGWLGRVGYPMRENRSIERVRQYVRSLANDLASLSESLGLVVGSIRKNQTWCSIIEIVEIAERGSDAELSHLLDSPLRIYGPKDYLTRWRHLIAQKLGFSFIPGGTWNEPPNSNATANIDLPSMEMVREQLNRKNIQQKTLADAIGWTESRVSRQLSGKSKSSQVFISTVANYLRQLPSQ